MLNAIGAYIYVLILLAIVSQRPSMVRFEAQLRRSWPLMHVCILSGCGYLLYFQWGVWRGSVDQSPWIPYIWAGFNVWIHEGGHFFMSWGPPLLHFLGGTLFELGTPAVIGAYAFVRGYWVVCGLTLFWLAFNSWSVARYMGDAAARALPLFGTEDVGLHDWWNIFGMLGILPYHKTIAGLTAAIGALAVAGGLWSYIHGIRSPLEAEVDGD